jgi:hypothetical protein
MATPNGQTPTSRSAPAVRCGICRQAIALEALHLETPSRTLGSFCSPRCLAAVEAVRALQQWSLSLEARGERDEAASREHLADDLLELWRRRAGPDPKAVGKAVSVAQTREAATTAEAASDTRYGFIALGKTK